MMRAEIMMFRYQTLLLGSLTWYLPMPTFFPILGPTFRLDILNENTLANPKRRGTVS